MSDFEDWLEEMFEESNGEALGALSATISDVPDCGAVLPSGFQACDAAGGATPSALGPDHASPPLATVSPADATEAVPGALTAAGDPAAASFECAGGRGRGRGRGQGCGGGGRSGGRGGARGPPRAHADGQHTPGASAPACAPAPGPSRRAGSPPPLPPPAAARRGRGRPPKVDGRYSREYLAVKSYRERRKTAVTVLEDEVGRKMAQVELLTAQNQMLRVRGAGACMAHTLQRGAARGLAWMHGSAARVGGAAHQGACMVPSRLLFWGCCGVV